METAVSYDLSRFCDPDSSRFALQQPWRADGFIYATDGKVAARIPDDGRELVIAEGRKPDCRQIFEPYFSQVVEWQAMPELPRCVECVAGIQCDGTGEMENDCEECNVRLGNRKFYSKLIYLFLPVPGLQWGICPTRPDPEDSIYFRGDGGFAGIAMPKRSDS